MLKYITWQQYLYILLTSGALYYAIILLLYYRGEISAIFSRKAYLDGTNDTMRPKNQSILGEIQQEPREPLLSSENLQFSPEPYEKHETEGNQ